MAIKSLKEIQDRKAFIRGDNDLNAQNSDSIWSLADLKKLEPDQIIDRIEQIDSQSELLKWRLWNALRLRFPSNNEFGDYIAALRNDPVHAICVDSQQNINRFIHAGRFCERHKIGDLNKAGISKSVIYLLSSPANAGIADEIFQSIRRKNVLHKDVQRMIEQAKAVVTIVKQPEPPLQQPERMDYEQHPSEHRESPIIEGVVVQETAAVQSVHQTTVINVQQAPALPEVAEAATGLMRHVAIYGENEQINSDNLAKRHDLLLNLLDLDATHLTEEQLKAEAKLLANSWRVSFMKQGALLIEAGKEILDKGYGK
jgi:hypothetical protein